MGTALNCSIACVNIVDGISGVHTANTSISNCAIFAVYLHGILGPGQTQLTRMPLWICWLDNPRVNATIAPLVEV